MHISVSTILGCLLICSSVACATPLIVEEVASGIYVHQGVHEDFDENYHGDIANVGFIVGKDVVAVIDTGGSRNVGVALREAIRKVTDLPIRYVINTHIHPDHIFGNAAFAEDKPSYVGHHKLADAMKLRGDAYLANLKIQLGKDAEGTRIILPSLLVETTYTLDLGGRKIELKAWPTAHTSNDLTIMDKNTGTFWMSDLLFIERTPSIDGDIKGWLKVIDELKNIPSKLAVPGHGKVTADKNKALENERRYLQTLLDDVRINIKNGTPMTDAMKGAAKTEKNSWVLFDLVNRRNVNIIYPVLEWE